jgi:hypothetical protein
MGGFARHASTQAGKGAKPESHRNPGWRLRDRDGGSAREERTKKWEQRRL